ncbi:MAG TPA: tRNA uridine-5-carboxymethylaminomethyl(34) synthesis GTPase MnmE [bacterium]|jgi:tRNA modification GTPase|nr:tRNA uridine-5-carboxymethylaminomethyl(34) synthesis GTPase MnmE [bacterium]
MNADTIVAIATAPGAAGVGVVRISGPAAVAVVSPLFKAFDGRALQDQPPRFLAFGKLHRAGGALLDEVMVVRFAAPHSFTGEDVVEVQAHGGAFHLREVQAALLESSRNFERPPRLARPGEFTQRAFLNGKIDLTRAEAVADLIQSGSELARAAAAQQLGGGLQRAIESLRAETLGLLAECEAACDFPEEHEQLPDAGAEFQARLGALTLRLDALLDTAQAGRMLTQGVRVALAGAPNAGKSSLFNALCDENRAIVSEEPGTTRDWLEVRVSSQGLTLVLYDTAGLREGASAVEAEGVRRTQELARGADVLLMVLDLSAPLDLRALDVMRDAGGAIELALNKSDLQAAWGKEELERALAAQGRAPRDSAALAARAQRVSARTREGLEGLLERVVDSALRGRGTQRLEAVALTQARHERAARDARASLERVRLGHRSGAGVELLSVDLRAALDALGEIIGATPRAQVLEEIFRRFCIGK